MTRLSFWRVPAFVLLLAGCSKANDSPAPPDAPSGARSATSAAPTASPSAASAVKSGAMDAAATDGRWSGHYAAMPGTFSVPDGGEWAGVRFRGEDASVGLGDGTLSVTVDPAGRAQGTLDGPLGPLRVTGELGADGFSAALVARTRPRVLGHGGWGARERPDHRDDAPLAPDR